MLKKKLDARGVTYDLCDKMDVMLAKGMRNAPALEVDGELMGFEDAVKWVGSYTDEGECESCKLN